MILAVDGGGTKTKVIVSDMNGNIVGEATSGPSSIDTVCLTTSIRNIIEAVSTIGEFMFNKVFLGLGGVASDDDSKSVVDLMSKERGFADATIICENDVVNAFFAALKDQQGMVLIVGTGSVCYGEGKSKHRSGGYGHFEGDPGSAYYLGRQVIKYIAKTLDDRMRKTDMIQDIMTDHKINSMTDYIYFIKEMYENRTRTAALAKYVTKHAVNKDQHACKIIDDACLELSLMVESVYRHIESNSNVVYVVGSLGLEQYFFEQLKKQLRVQGNFELQKSVVEPVYGALFAAGRL